MTNQMTIVVIGSLRVNKYPFPESVSIPLNKNMLYRYEPAHNKTCVTSRLRPACSSTQNG